VILQKEGSEIKRVEAFLKKLKKEEFFRDPTVFEFFEIPEKFWQEYKMPE
jgi:predicted nuclease of restriction endonuclease-like (RecB) superfamily